jgi:DnaJ-domain-containing protein 1
MDELDKDVTDSSPEEEKTVPYERFKEVYGEVKTLKEEIASIKQSAETQSGGLTPAQKQELEAKEYLAKMIDERMSESEAKKAKAAEEEQKNFEEELKNVLELNSSVDKDKFLNFLENEADEYGDISVKGAMAIYKKLNDTSKEAQETVKRNLASKPKMPSSDGKGGEVTYDDKGKSFYQIAEEAKKSL